MMQGPRPRAAPIVPSGYTEVSASEFTDVEGDLATATAPSTEPVEEVTFHVADSAEAIRDFGPC